MTSRCYTENGCDDMLEIKEFCKLFLAGDIINTIAFAKILGSSFADV